MWEGEGARECMRETLFPRKERKETNERSAVAGCGAYGGVDTPLLKEERRGRHQKADVCIPPSGKMCVGGVNREACGGVQRFLRRWERSSFWGRGVGKGPFGVEARAWPPGVLSGERGGSQRK